MCVYFPMKTSFIPPPPRRTTGSRGSSESKGPDGNWAAGVRSGLHRARGGGRGVCGTGGFTSIRKSEFHHSSLKTIDILPVFFRVYDENIWDAVSSFQFPSLPLIEPVIQQFWLIISGCYLLFDNFLVFTSNLTFHFRYLLAIQKQSVFFFSCNISGSRNFCSPFQFPDAFQKALELQPGDRYSEVWGEVDWNLSFFLYFFQIYLVWSFRLLVSWLAPLRHYSSSKFPSFYSLLPYRLLASLNWAKNLP